MREEEKLKRYKEKKKRVIDIDVYIKYYIYMAFSEDGSLEANPGWFQE